LLPHLDEQLLVNRLELITALKKYKTDFDAERSFIAPFQHLLQNADAYSRHHLPGHVTGSAWIIDKNRGNVLLTHHAKLNRWLQPGGHADGDEDIFKVAWREAVEETGLPKFTLLQKGVFDIDIHVIPERNGFPAHDHYDIRILLEADPEQEVTISQESHDVRWVQIENLAERSGNNTSMLRMAEKVKQLFAADQ
jgi:8-oxo-dGTP pyrophosphatase MutT (NUDIX family)